MSKTPHPLTRIPAKFLPFADAASDDFPIQELLRLSLFQVSVGMATVMLLGTLNRVMIVELSVPAMVVAMMIALPVMTAPFRALMGFKSDNYRSAIGWKRIPYMWFGTLWQMGGLAVMPFALIVLSGDQTLGPDWAGEVLAAAAFLMTGLGIHMTQTVGLALASDRATEETRPRVVALLYVMYLIGMGISAIIVGWLLRDFSQLTLIRVVQGTAVVTVVLNLVALWKQERMKPMSKEERSTPPPSFGDAWADLARGGRAGRLLAVVGIGTLAFNMQDVLLEPYGGQVLGLSVSSTTLLTGIWAIGALLAFGLAAKWLAGGMNHYRMGARGIIAGIAAFAIVIFAGPLNSPLVFFIGAGLIGFGGGLFSVSTLIAAMSMPVEGIAGRGLALGAWGASQATAAGLAVAIGGTVRDVVNHLALADTFGAGLNTPATGYAAVYHIEIVLLFVTLMVLGPLVRPQDRNHPNRDSSAKIGLADFPT